MKNKKVAAVVLSLGLGSVLLSGCSNDYGFLFLDNNSNSSSTYDNSSVNDDSSYDVSSLDDTTNVTDDNSNDNSVYDTSEQAAPVQQSDTPQIGMIGDQVKSTTWGKPAEDNKTTIAGDVSEQWVYYDDGTPDRYVYLDNGIVTAIQDQE